MAQDGGSGRQNQDRNPSSGSSLLLWAGLIVATGLLVIMWAAPYFTREIRSADLMALIKASPHEDFGAPAIMPGATGMIVVREEGKPPIEYSELKEVVIR